MAFIYVAIGGGLGAVLRYGTSRALPPFAGTIAVNIIGSFIMGMVFIHLASHPRAGFYGPLLMTGILGGFTTFSAFSLDTLRLIEAGNWGAAMGYVLITVLLSLGGLAVGMAMARGL